MTKFLVITAVLIVSLLVTVPVYAALGTAPTLNLHEAWAVRNVAQSGDVLVVTRLSLPSATWDTYTVDGAILELNQSNSLLQTRVPSTLGESISAFYLSPGHSFTWAASATVDLHSNPALFATNTTDSVPVTFLATTALVATSTADQDIVCDALRDTLVAVESESSSDDIDSNDLVQANTIPAAGTTMALNAFGAFANVLPNCFFVGVTDSPDFEGGTPGLQNSRETLVEGSDAWTRWDALAADYGFEDEAIAAALFGLVLTGTAWIIFSLFTQSAMYGSTMAAMVMLAAAMNAPHYLLKGVFVLIALTSILAGGFWFARAPR